MKFFLIAVILAAVAGAGLLWWRSALGGQPQTPNADDGRTLWQFSTRTLEGKPVDLKDWQGRVALVVNVASKCGLTQQYEGLEALYLQRREAGLVVLGFPSNDFLGQEPGTPAQIREFCSTKFDVSFPLFEKVAVKGDDRCEIYRWLTAGGLEEPSWNFTKYLVGRDGRIIARFAPKTAPDDPALLAAIDRALGE